MRRDQWDNILGKDRGGSVYALLLSRRHGHGAVPGRIKIQHGERNENSNSKDTNGNPKWKNKRK